MKLLMTAVKRIKVFQAFKGDKSLTEEWISAQIPLS